MQSITESRFAVVGHPNKGKSSLVATLAQNDQIAVSEISGTTLEAQYFDFKIDGKVCYQLIDTPGFQRARKLLSELKSQTDSVADRRAVLQKFVSDPANAQTYPDEYQLLKPIMEGAAIIYVVDGAAPYSFEYEPEMEILQWTGQPRMAVINPINNDDYVDHWLTVLDQYFSTVRIFNPLQSDFDAQVELLKIFSTLRQDWAKGIDATISALIAQREQKAAQAARIIMATVSSMLQFQIEHNDARLLAELPFSSKKVPTSLDNLTPDDLYSAYCKTLRAMESVCWNDLKTLFTHHNMQQQAPQLAVEDDDLFNEASWQIWGLKKSTVISLAAGSGAASGALIDAAVGGTSLMAGSIIGGIAGSGAAALFGKNLAKSKIGGILPLGKLTQQLGPVKNPAFSWSILGRQLYYAAELYRRNHARRDALKLETPDLQPLHLKDQLASFSKGDLLKLTLWLNSGGKKGNPIKIQEILKRMIRQD